MSAVAGCIELSSGTGEVAAGLVSQLLSACGEARIRVSGTSMLPSIRPADVLHIRPVDIATVQTEDVIVVARDRRLFTHRVVRVDRRDGERVLITRGDMHGHDDPPVTEADLLGRVEGQTRRGTGIPLGRAPRRYLRRGPLLGFWFECLCSMRVWAQTIRSLGASRY